MVGFPLREYPHPHNRVAVGPDSAEEGTPHRWALDWGIGGILQVCVGLGYVALEVNLATVQSAPYRTFRHMALDKNAKGRAREWEELDNKALSYHTE